MRPLGADAGVVEADQTVGFQDVYERLQALEGSTQAAMSVSAAQVDACANRAASLESELTTIRSEVRATDAWE